MANPGGFGPPSLDSAELPPSRPCSSDIPLRVERIPAPWPWPGVWEIVLVHLRASPLSACRAGFSASGDSRPRRFLVLICSLPDEGNDKRQSDDHDRGADLVDSAR